MINQQYTRKLAYEDGGRKYYTVYCVGRVVASDTTEDFSRWVIRKRDEELRIYKHRNLKQGE